MLTRAAKKCDHVCDEIMVGFDYELGRIQDLGYVVVVLRLGRLWRILVYGKDLEGHLGETEDIF